MSQEQAYTLSQLSSRITGVLANDAMLRGAWVVGETMDLRVAGGHCYFDLLEKDASGKIIARARCTVWSSVYGLLRRKFQAATGQDLVSDMKVMVRVSANYHAVYGLSLNVGDIYPEFTLGDAQRRRAESIERLRREGIIDMNRTLAWPLVAQRVAIISAHGAAGYGDFINQLFRNPSHLRFTARLFPAYMQGERTAPTIIEALEQIAADYEEWDCVVIIRGGGATSDLIWFDDYDLAAHVAQFPLPVVIGIGHERDVTLLDYVANMRVKTPTAAAEWLVQLGEQQLDQLKTLAQSMLQSVTDKLGGCHRQLAYISGQLPAMAQSVVMRAQQRLQRQQTGLAGIADRKLLPERARLAGLVQALEQSASFAILRARQKLDAAATLVEALSPESTLRRGYTITRVDGHAVSSKSQVASGARIVTTFADGEVGSVVEG